VPKMSQERKSGLTVSREKGPPETLSGDSGTGGKGQQRDRCEERPSVECEEGNRRGLETCRCVMGWGGGRGVVGPSGG
jgi:hypothetical protein